MIIAICDDNRFELNQLSSYVTEYMNRNNFTFELICYESGEELILQADKYQFDVVFLDIYLKKLTGIQTAIQLKALQNTNIIFTTTSTEHAIQAFSLSAVHYLLKPICYEEVEISLNRCNLNNTIEPIFSCKIDGIQIPILEKKY